MSGYSAPPVKPESLAVLNPYITLTGATTSGRSKDVTYQNTKDVPEYSYVSGHVISVMMSPDGEVFTNYFKTGDYGGANVVVPSGWYVRSEGSGSLYAWYLLEFDA